MSEDSNLENILTSVISPEDILISGTDLVIVLKMFPNFSNNVLGCSLIIVASI